MADDLFQGTPAQEPCGFRETLIDSVLRMIRPVAKRFPASFHPDPAPGLHQPVHIPGCIGGAGRRKADAGPPGRRLRVFPVHFLSRPAVDIDL